MKLEKLKRRLAGGEHWRKREIEQTYRYVLHSLHMSVQELFGCDVEEDRRFIWRIFSFSQTLYMMLQ